MNKINANLDLTEIKDNLRKFKENEPQFLFNNIDSLTYVEIEECIVFIDANLSNREYLQEEIDLCLDQIKSDLAKQEISDINEYRDLEEVEIFISEKAQIVKTMEETNYKEQYFILIEEKQSLKEKLINLKIQLNESQSLSDDEITVLIDVLTKSTMSISQVSDITENPKKIIKLLKEKGLDSLFKQ